MYFCELVIALGKTISLGFSQGETTPSIFFNKLPLLRANK